MPTRMVKIKKRIKPTFAKDIEEMDFSYTANGSTKQKQSGNFL